MLMQSEHQQSYTMSRLREHARENCRRQTMRLLIFMAGVANRIGSLTGTFALQGTPSERPVQNWRHETSQSSHAPARFYRAAQRR
jgi:hypothetical protein